MKVSLELRDTGAVYVKLGEEMRWYLYPTRIGINRRYRHKYKDLEEGNDD